MPMDWYAILEVEPTANATEIRTAYRKQALRSHPDRAAAHEKEDATSRFKMIAEAYEVLGDDRRRWEYDRFEYPLLNGEMGYDAFDNHASTSPTGHTFVWESSFDSARRANQGRPGPEGFGRGAFVDPFELFSWMFARDFHEMETRDTSLAASSNSPAFTDDPFGANGPFGMGMPMGAAPSTKADPFDHFGRAPGFGFNANPFNVLSGFPPTHTTGGMGNAQSMFSSSSNMSSFGGTSESRQTTVVNGRRETVITKRDAQGNETVRRISPSGETVLINGELQPTLGAAPKPAELTDQSGQASAPPVEAPREQPQAQKRKKWKLF
ncbi:hypothetical protein MVES1_002370 [Malassezia vespertilionis]|uniref:J domain-containing protein n=1 Tax=Malassezia vespertilionis TaxID=2020962 RepID=A0A2N1JBG9_9BASI|nr:uncharacterized protein MVES1_002370 [Malassezia vespertilionis]PKI83876.1 hypothetical protein MVES_002236 [Malassezia vespertilionis]WFD07014.1 hypothetical protein MVES1_002370 [Malassezia vespertilionis]